MTCHFQFLNTHYQHELMLKLAENKHCCEGIANVYTDGSFFGAYSGLGVYIEEFSFKKTFKKHYYHHKHSGPRKELICFERNAVRLAIKLCESLNLTKINLIIDHHMVFRELLDTSSELYCLINESMQLCHIFLVFSHIGIIGNEIADRLANSSKLLTTSNQTYKTNRFSSLKLTGLLKLGVLLRKKSPITENIVPAHLTYYFEWLRTWSFSWMGLASP